MSVPTRSVSLAAIALVACFGIAADWEPLSVEVQGDVHRPWEPIVVRVTNMSDKPISMAFRLFVWGKRKSKNSARGDSPLELEKKAGDRWVWAGPPHFISGRQGPDQLAPGEAFDYRLGIAGAGEYRVRVWYLIRALKPGPPREPAVIKDVQSAPFVVSENK